MMYLMLTAMLALNVSGDLLNAFKLVDDGIKKSTEVVTQKVNKQYLDFDAINTQNPKKAGDNYKKALELQEKADALYKQLQYYKCLMVTTADGPEYTPDNFISTSNQDIAAQLMLVEKGGARGDSLKNYIDDYREYLIGMCSEDSARVKSFREQFNTDNIKNPDGDVETWVGKITEHLPLAATMAILSKVQNDVRSSQSDIVNMLYAKVDEASFKFTGIKPLIIPESNYVLRGGTYKANIMLAAYDETMDPIVTVDNQKLPVENGQGIYEVPASQVGQKNFSARIQIPDPVTGELKSYDVSSNYEVGEPSVVVSPTKMNVFYIGLDNPVEISAAGISSSDLKVSASGATISRKGNQFVVRPSASGGHAKISVSAEVNGKTQRLGEKDFRIMKVPNPEAVVGGMSGGSIKKSILNVQTGVIAEMKDFVFDLKFTITRFTVSAIKAGFMQSLEATSASFTPQQKQLLQGLAVGNKFYIENIEATGPDGKRKLGSLAFTVKQ
ncbi:MAG: gliding motility protein GldM [Bacteroidales bacterium]|nr:gliding motility protein GldM [Bacteroidales bacterium]